MSRATATRLIVLLRGSYFGLNLDKYPAGRAEISCASERVVYQP
jgi:hypothetical protein